MIRDPKKAPRASKGYNTNLASEFYVMSVLYRLGFDANLTLGNKKAVDIVVVHAPGDSVTIDVKAVAGRVDWLVGSAGGPVRPRHFVVLVAYDGKFGAVAELPKAWVLPHQEFLQLIRSAKPPSAIRFIRRSDMGKLAHRVDAWQLLAGQQVT